MDVLRSCQQLEWAETVVLVGKGESECFLTCKKTDRTRAAVARIDLSEVSACVRQGSGVEQLCALADRNEEMKS